MKKEIYVTILLGLLAFCGYAATEKSGALVRNEHWTLAGSPYLISDDLLVPRDVTLRIDPGVQILAGRPVAYSKQIPQADRIDSFMVSIRVQGTLRVAGKPGQPIIFASQQNSEESCTWYGLILDAPADQGDITYVEIADACNALSIVRGRPAIRNCVASFSNVGITVSNKAQPQIVNSIITRNTTAGIFVQNANPSIFNSIISFNHGNGILSDGRSNLDIRYNCLFGNGDRDCEACDPRIGIVKKKVRDRYPADAFDNLLCDPVFAGSVADSVAVEKDLSLATDRSKVKNIDLLALLHKGKTVDSLAAKKRTATYKRWVLSRYSPCINAGNPAPEFFDGDGSRNDMGIYGASTAGSAPKSSPKATTHAAAEPKSPHAPAAPEKPAAAHAPAPAHGEKTPAHSTAPAHTEKAAEHPAAEPAHAETKPVHAPAESEHEKPAH